MKVTEQQRRAIEARGTDVLVSASAGSGKTEVLALRCAALVADADRPCPVDRLLVVTFTRAAAAELRSRVARKLREQFRTGPTAHRAYLRRQLARMGAAEICTLDAWYARIVRDHFGAAGVDPRFEPLSADEARMLREETLDGLFEDIFAGREAGVGPAVLEWLRRSGNSEDRFLRDMVQAADEFESRLVSPSEWRRGARVSHEAADSGAAARAVLAPALLAELELQRDALAAWLSAAGGAGATGRLPAYFACLGEWSAALKTSPEALLGVIDAWEECPLRAARRGSAAPPFESQVRELWLNKRLRGAWKDVREWIGSAADASHLALTLLDLVAAFQTRLRRAKRERGVCEFADVQRMALDLLGGPEREQGGPRTPSDVALALRERYEHVLVDEFQDISPIQAETLRLVSRGGSGGPGNRFLVGDVKQCIYAFRSADPRIIVATAAAMDRGDAGGLVVPLTDNFRAHARLIDAINAVFVAVFRAELGGAAYDDRHRLVARRDELPNRVLDAAARFEVHVLEAPASGGRGEREPDEDSDGAAAARQPLEQIEREAALVAERIRDMLAGGVEVLDRVDGRPVLRPLRYADVAILARKGVANTALVARALRSARIPCIAGGREKLLESMQVSDLRSVLALLVDRDDDIAMAAYLRGPLVGLTEPELAAVRAAGPRGSYAGAVERYARHGPDGALRERVAGALRGLDAWLALSRTLELPALIRRIIRDGDLESFALGLPAGEHRVEELRALQRFASGFPPGSGVGEFVQYLDDLAQREVEPETPVSAGADAVRVMTIHAAKGLEFPVVFLVGTGAELRRAGRTPVVRFDEALGLGLSFNDVRARRVIRDARYASFRMSAQRAALSEEMRLLYVAATRARELLVVVGHAPAPVQPIAARDEPRPAAAGEVAPLGEVPLITLLSARSMLDWVRIGVAAARAAEGGPNALVQECEHGLEAAVTGGGGGEAGKLSAPSWTAGDEAWVARAAATVAAPATLEAANWPAVLAASELKTRTVRGRTGDGRAEAMQVALRPPLVGGGRPGAARADVDLETVRWDAAGGAVRGTACHRFLQHADLQRLSSAAAVADEAQRLSERGLLAASDVPLVPADDVAWFFGETMGRQVASAATRVRREVPFVRALPIPAPGDARPDDFLLIRGQIDCILDEADGLTILDYKTDALESDAEVGERVAHYGPQLTAYGWAAGGILARPVARLVLVFLRARRIELVPMTRDPEGVLRSVVVSGFGDGHRA